MLSEILLIGITVFAAFLASLAQYLFKTNLPRFKASISGILEIFKNKRILLGVLIYFVSLPIYLFALRNGDLSFVYPTFATSFIFVLLLSKFGIGEDISPIRLFGVLLVVVGIAIIAFTF
ncbi:MAG: hypothetical protein ACP5P2_01225 [Candidatus Micrarchaeia archaeon]|jgi:drug/metabolite transporter (DMT)-like permease